MQQAAQLRAPFGAEERVQLVNHDVLQAREQRADCPAAQDEECFERFGRDEQDPVGPFQDGGFFRAGNVAVPAMDRDFQPLAQARQPVELIIDQGFQRSHVEDTNSRLRGAHRWLAASRSAGKPLPSSRRLSRPR